jgi:hypothetical protein
MMDPPLIIGLSKILYIDATSLLRLLRGRSSEKYWFVIIIYRDSFPPIN